MERILLPLRRIIAEYVAEFEFVDFDPPQGAFMPLAAIHKKPDFMKLLRENPGRVIHGAFVDVDQGKAAGDDRWILEPQRGHKWTVLPEMPRWEQIREISKYSICMYATSGGYELLEKNPARVMWACVYLFKDDPWSELDLLILTSPDDELVDVDQIIRLNDAKITDFHRSKKYTAKFISVVSDDVNRALSIPISKKMLQFEQNA